MPLAITKEGTLIFLDRDGTWKPAPMSRTPEGKKYVWDGEKWRDAPGDSRYTNNLGQLGTDLARGAASGATAGFAPDIEGAIRGQDVRKQYEDIPAGVRIPSEMAGALAASAALAPLGAAAGAARIPSWLRTIAGPGLLGALQGAGAAGPGNRLQGAAVGGGAGLLTGGVIPPLMGVASKVAQPEANAALDLGRSIARSNTTVPEVQKALTDVQSFRPGATIADVGGEGVSNLMERIANTPGSARTQITDFLSGRQRDQMSRLSTDLRGLTGTTKSATQATEDVIAQRKAAGAPAYDAAMNFNARNDPDIVRAWTEATSTGWGKQFLNNSEFRRTLQTEYGIADPANAPLMVQIDTWKKVADDFIRANRGTNKARVVDGMVKDVLGVVDTKNPAYAVARDTWAGPSRFLDQIDEGRDIFNVPAEEFAAQWAKMGTSEREAYTIGAVSQIVQKLRSSSAKLPDSTVALRSPEMRDKIIEMMPTPEAKDKWAKILDYEIKASELTNTSMGNSRTAFREAMQGDREDLAKQLVTDALSFWKEPVRAALGKVGDVYDAARGTVMSRSNDIVTDVLTGKRPLSDLLDAAAAVSKNAPPTMPRAGAVGAVNQGLLDTLY